MKHINMKQYPSVTCSLYIHKINYSKSRLAAYFTVRSLLYNPGRNAAKKNTQQHNRFCAFWESFFTWLTWHEHNIIYDGFSPKEAFYSIFSLALQVLYMRFSSWRQKIKKNNLIMVPHLKLFSICGVTGKPRSSTNVCHVPGHAQAHPHTTA